MTYNIYSNDLCMDVFSEVTDIDVELMTEFSVLECEKNLIYCFDDYGQFGSSDGSTVEKLFSPFGKFLDECDLSNKADITLKEYAPFDEYTYTDEDGEDVDY